MQPGRYRHRRGSRAPGAGGRRAPVGRAAAGRTRSRRGRGSGGRGRWAGRSAPGGGRGPRPRAEGSQRGWLQPESKRQQGGGGGLGREAAEGVPRKSGEGCGSYPGTAGSTLLATGVALDRARAGSGGPGTARGRSADGRGQAKSVVEGGGDPSPSHPHLGGLLLVSPCAPPPTHSSFPSGWQTHQTVTQAAGVGGVGEVCSVGVLFPSKGTAWGRGELWAGERPPFPQGMLPSQP